MVKLPLDFSITKGGNLMEKLKKGEHERAMEKAKEMLDKGCGMGEIVEETKLSEENVLKAKRKWVDRS